MPLGREKRKARFYLQDGPTVEGVLAGKTRETYVVWAPRIIEGEAAEARVEVSGHVEIPKSRVLWFQVIG